MKNGWKGKTMKQISHGSKKLCQTIKKFINN